MRFPGLIVGLLAALVAAVILGLGFGATELDFSDLMAKDSGADGYVFWQIRLPRVLMGIVVGVHFALSGMVLQTTTRNALADPGILGISGGAILFMTFFVLFDIAILEQGIERYLPRYAFLSIAALVGGMLGALAVFTLSWKGGLVPGRFVLVGVAIGAFCHSVALGLIFGWGPTQLDILWLWMAGSLYSSTWKALYFILPWTFVGLIGLILGFRQIAMLRLDDDGGKSRGFAVQYWRLVSLVIACIFAGSAVGVVGPVGFVGLIVPHIARRIAPEHLGAQFITTGLIGAVLCVSADVLGRYVFAPAEVPVGVLTSLIGAPVLFFLLFPVRLKFSLKSLRLATR